MTPLIHWVESNIGLTVTIITTLIAPLIYYVYIVNRIYDFEYYFLSFRERFWLFIAVVIFSIIVFSILTTLTILTYLSTKKIWTSIVGFIITIIYFSFGIYVFNKNDHPIITILNKKYILKHQIIDGNYLLKDLNADKYILVDKSQIINKPFIFESTLRKRKKQ